MFGGFGEHGILDETIVGGVITFFEEFENFA